MDIVINLLLFYSKTLVVLLMFQQVSNQPIKPLWNIIGPFLYVLLKISMVVKHLIFFMACTPLSFKAC